jgi:hypothetical protein
MKNEIKIFSQIRKRCVLQKIKKLIKLISFYSNNLSKSSIDRIVNYEPYNDEYKGCIGDYDPNYDEDYHSNSNHE